MPAPSREAPESELAVRTRTYLAMGLFNPEMANHRAVYELVEDLSREVASLSAAKDALHAERDELKARLQKTPWCEICGEVVRECPRCFTVFNTQGDL